MGHRSRSRDRNDSSSSKLKKSIKDRKYSRSPSSHNRYDDDKNKSKDQNSSSSKKRDSSCSSVDQWTKHDKESKNKKKEDKNYLDSDSKEDCKKSKKKKKKKSKEETKDTKKKHKKKNKKYSDSSSSESNSSDSEDPVDDEAKLFLQLERERVRRKEEKLQQKEFRKATEAPEEKRLRRLQKKEAKERKRKEKMGWDSEYLHFTNADNPYGDNNLLETYVWDKKLQKDGQSNLSREEIEKQNRLKMEENRQELEKVKRRRHERELERTERERLMELEQRQREAAQFNEFSRQEDNFQLQQARIRSQIRIQDERAKPIDLLAQYVSSEGDMTAVDMHEPYTHLTGLTLPDLEDLLEDIKVYQQLEKQDGNQCYWQDLTVIVVDEVRRLRQRDRLSHDATSGTRHGIHSAVAADVSEVFKHKSAAELASLKLNIQTKLAGPTQGIDIGYWESLLSQLKAHQARARLRERHRENLCRKLQLLKAEQGVIEDDSSNTLNIKSTINEDSEVKKEEPINSNDSTESENELSLEESSCTLVHTALDAYTSGRYSPKLLSQTDLEPGTVVVSEQEDVQRLTWSRGRAVGGDQGSTTLSPEETSMHKQAQMDMAGDEVQFSVEAKLDPQHYLWSDKYRPRKPRYFNRVHTGFEWNKYNQTHYDMDNPPPKIVQGYKFNIFYPDLIDKAKTPQYELIPCQDNKDFAILKFVAGPPYEDIAFKIVSREWEYSYKRGFRCQFHNNIFQLWFHFKRYRYRR